MNCAGGSRRSPASARRRTGASAARAVSLAAALALGASLTGCGWRLGPRPTRSGDVSDIDPPLDAPPWWVSSDAAERPFDDASDAPFERRGADVVPLDAPPARGDAATPEATAADAPCASGLIACDARCVDRHSDNMNCGACGVACGVDRVCTVGMCACRAGLSECGASCVNRRTDPAHCGACGNRCAAGVCANGLCG